MTEEFRIEKYATFLNNFEQWIDAIVTQESMSEAQLIERVKESYERSLQANYEHHSKLAKAMQSGESQSARRHTVIANIYKALLK
jgi:Na+/phosphate symporter